jgi:hypothetical protein
MFVTNTPDPSPEGVRNHAFMIDMNRVTPATPAKPPGRFDSAKCRIPEAERSELQRLTVIDRLTKAEELQQFPLDRMAQFAKAMFGYSDAVFTTFNAFGSDARTMLNHTNLLYNPQIHRIKNGEVVDERSVDVQHARFMARIFEYVTANNSFLTARHGLVYRSFSDGITSAKKIADKPLNRFTSTSLVKRYSDRWGQDAGNGVENTKGFYSTIIIPAGTTELIPLLLFDLPSKKMQYEVLLSPDGVLRDTGFVDNHGFKIFIYVDSKHSRLTMEQLLMLEVDGTNVLGFIQCVFGDAIWQGLTGGKKNTRKKKRRRTKYIKKILNTTR